MGSVASISVQRWQKSGKDPLNQFANAENKVELKRRLLDEQQLCSELRGATNANPGIAAAIYSVIGGHGGGTTPDEEEINVDTSKEVDTSEEARAAQRASAVELLIGTTQRLNNIKIYNFFIVVLSLLALAFNVPVAFWAILSSMGLLFSKNWTLKLAKELGDEVAREEWEDASHNVGWLVADNKCYMMKQTFMHARIDEHGAPRANGQMLYTNNRLHSPVLVDTEVDIELGESNLIKEKLTITITSSSCVGARRRSTPSPRTTNVHRRVDERLRVDFGSAYVHKEL